MTPLSPEHPAMEQLHRMTIAGHPFRREISPAR